MKTEHKISANERKSQLAQVVERNIHALLARRRAEEKKRDLQDRVADAITRFSGSMPFIYLHVALFGAWVIINLGLIPLIAPFDPTFVVLATFASVEAIFLSTFVLITQNRMAELADKRAELDLQISLLAEHEITRLITLTTAICRRMGIRESNDPELKELEKDVRPEEVLDTIEKDRHKNDS